MDDAVLLREYTDRQSEPAFGELVRRHVDLVHSAALRQAGGNATTAADVTQAVFIELARQAGRLKRHPTLTGWLYTVTRRVASQVVRAETRRQRREWEAQHMQETLRELSPTEAECDWDRVRPVLDSAMHILGETDRLAVLLRHFENRPFAEVGARIGMSENAARMRVSRALEKLRAVLMGQGVNSTAAALAAVLSGHAVSAAPPGLSAGIATMAAASASTLGFLPLMASIPLKTATAVALIVSAGAALMLQAGFNKRLRAANQDLQQRTVELAAEIQAARLAVAESARELARLQEPSGELLRLRGEVAQLRGQLAEAKAPGSQPAVRSGSGSSVPLLADRPSEPFEPGGEFVPVERWGNAGTGTPAAAAMTILWAWRSRNLALLKEVSEPMTEEMRQWLAENDPRGLDEDLRMERSAFMVDSVGSARVQSVEMSKPGSNHSRVRIESRRPQMTNELSYGIDLLLAFDGEAWRLPAREIPGSKP